MSDYSQSNIVHHKASRFSESSNPTSDYEYTTNPLGTVPSPQSPPPWHVQPEHSPILEEKPSPTSTNVVPTDGTHPSYQRQTSPDRNGGYPEVVAVPEGKEAYHPSPRAPSYNSTAYAPSNTYPQSGTYHASAYADQTYEDQHTRQNRICGMTKKLCLIVSAIILILIIALAVGLGVGLSHSKKSSKHHKGAGSNASEILIGGAIAPQYYSTQGAFNGTGIAIASVNFGIDASIYVFYQKYNGEIDQLIYRADGTWAFVTTVAQNARNATALSAVAYIVNEVATWHLFYFDENRYLKQRVQNNASAYQTNIWQDGPINQLNLQGNDAELVGMQACYWGNYYGSDTDFNDGFTPSKTNPQVGMNLWYGSDNSTFQQYDWTHGDAQWNHSITWHSMNTHAGVGCQSWLTNTTYYVVMVDQNDTMRVYWKDIDTNKTSTAQHPIDTWEQTNIAIPNVQPATSLGYTDFLAYQAMDNTIHGLNVSWAAENTTIAPAPAGDGGLDNSGLDQWAMQAQDAGLPGTHFSITGLDAASGGRSEVILYQQTGNDIRLGRRDADEGDFTFNTVPVGDGLN